MRDYDRQIDVGDGWARGYDKGYNKGYEQSRTQ
jgi:hypothetical protein